MGLTLVFGIVVIWPDLAHGGPADEAGSGVIALQVACFGWSVGSSYSKRHGRSENVFMATAAQMLAGGVMMILLGTLRGEWSALAFSTRTAVAFGYLSTIGAIGGFVAYTYALRHLPVSLVSLYYINLVIAVALRRRRARRTAYDARRSPPLSCSAAWSTGTRPAHRRRHHARRLSSSDLTSADQPHQEEHDGDDDKDMMKLPRV